MNGTRFRAKRKDRWVPRLPCPIPYGIRDRILLRTLLFGLGTGSSGMKAWFQARLRLTTPATMSAKDATFFLVSFSWKRDAPSMAVMAVPAPLHTA